MVFLTNKNHAMKLFMEPQNLLNQRRDIRNNALLSIMVSLVTITSIRIKTRCSYLFFQVIFILLVVHIWGCSYPNIFSIFCEIMNQLIKPIQFWKLQPLGFQFMITPSIFRGVKSVQYSKYFVIQILTCQILTRDIYST